MFSLLNPALLLGLVGLSLPVLAHLLSRRKYDVVPWGAMQFLELGHRTRRRIRLEEILLLLLRMLMIGLIVLALCRPWVSAGWIARVFGAQSWVTRLLVHQTRDVVLIVDGSYSMGWEGRAVTPHAAAIQWSHRFLEALGPGDSVALLDARDRVRAVVDTPTRDFSLVRKQLDKLPKPSGSSELSEAIAQGIRLLARGTNLTREVIVITDGQSRCWSPSDEARWDLLDDLQSQQTVKPRVWVVDVGDGAKGDRTNFALDRLEISREFVPVDLPVRVKTKLRYTGGQAGLQRRVWLEADGQRLAEATVQTPLLEPGSEFPVEFEHRFASVGSHRLSVVLDADNLPGDNRAEAAVTVAAAIPVLIVDGDENLDPTRSESFFAMAALGGGGGETPLVKSTKIAPAGLTPESLALPPQAVCLMNVPQLTAAQADMLLNYVAAGGGLLVAPGDKLDPRAYNTLLFGEGNRALPAAFQKVEVDTAQPPAPGVSILDASLKLPLVTSLRREHDGGFTDARFVKWWSVDLAKSPKDQPPAPAGVTLPKASEPIVAARFSTNAPYLVLRTYGRGRVAQLTAPLDSDWSTLPAKPDYVSFLHELLFHLAGGAAPSRNVLVGDPLVVPAARGVDPKAFVFLDPAGQTLDAVLTGDEVRPSLQLDRAELPGLYRFVPRDQAVNAAATGEQFIVDFERAESDFKPLSDADRKRLAGEGRLKFVNDVDELAAELHSGGPRSEIWRVLMLLMLVFLVGELVLTRRLVRGGHAAGEASTESGELSQAA